MKERKHVWRKQENIQWNAFVLKRIQFGSFFGKKNCMVKTNVKISNINSKDEIIFYKWINYSTNSLFALSTKFLREKSFFLTLQFMLCKYSNRGECTWPKRILFAFNLQFSKRMQFSMSIHLNRFLLIYLEMHIQFKQQFNKHFGFWI